LNNAARRSPVSEGSARKAPGTTAVRFRRMCHSQSRARGV